MNRVLSKSKFKLGLECPNKLYFTDKKEYVNTQKSNTFLQALAQGGFQVEALARYDYPNGILMDRKGKSYEELAEETRLRLQEDNVVLFEAAFLYEGLFVHVDILTKQGNKIQLIEVKAKSYKGESFLGKDGGIDTRWKPYLFDIAFQKYVVSRCQPALQIEAYLCMADKTKAATVNGLNQMFRFKGDNRREPDVRIDPADGVGDSVLRKVPVDDIIENIIRDEHPSALGDKSFSEAVTLLRNVVAEGRFPEWDIRYTTCRTCEFKATAEEEKNGFKSGFKHCFSTMKNWKEEDFHKPNIFEIAQFKTKRRDELVSGNRFFMEELVQEDVMGKGRMSDTAHRQWLQVEKAVNGDFTPAIKTVELRSEMQKWIFPLHFIDFETSAAALPFLAGDRPYQDVAFQFSHHIYHADGTIEHATEFMEATPGVNPNLAFVRALKKALEKDRGSVFRYSDHENKILVNMVPFLSSSNEPHRNELIDFIKEITRKMSGKVIEWQGERCMIDLCAVVKKCYYNPHTKGSNSLKAVLPSILKSSDFLKKKYTQPLGEIRVSSRNFSENHIWLNRNLDDPYHQLPKLFEEMTPLEKEENISEMEDIKEGSAALTAYAMLQYTDMPEREREEIMKGLRQYCELDTLAMVMLYEHLLEMANSNLN